VERFSCVMEKCVLTINGGSSSIKFALFEADDALRRIFSGKIDGVGQAQGSFTVKGASPAENFARGVNISDHTAAVGVLVDWMREGIGDRTLAAIGHRVVHGGPKYWEPQCITPEMVAALHQLSPFDPEHLPEEILLTEAFHRKFPELPQIACFDTAFHHDMPLVAQLLPIPRRYHEKGVRRYGFHGLSCAYLMEALAQSAGAEAAQGRVVLAHLGNGASITAVRGGKSLDTSMSFTPTAGLPMSTRSGDLDPGISWYLFRAEELTAQQFHHMINHESGLLGISETSSDMRELFAREKQDARAAEAIDMFCYHARKWICAMAAAAEGLDTLVFAGGIGENAPPVRSRICRGLEWLGIKLDEAKNDATAAVISADKSPVTVRVIRTDEEWVIARLVCGVLTRAQQTKEPI
jgi:acetate kinase